MNIKTTILFLSLLIAAPSYCQQQDTISLQSFRTGKMSLLSWHSGGRKMYLYKQGNQDYRPVGPRAKTLKPILLSQPRAKKEWEKSRVNMAIAMVGGAAAGIGAFLVYNESTEDRFSEGNTIRNVGYGAFFTGAALTFTFERLTQRSLRKSVEKYNMEILRDH